MTTGRSSVGSAWSSKRCEHAPATGFASSLAPVARRGRPTAERAHRAVLLPRTPRVPTATSRPDCRRAEAGKARSYQPNRASGGTRPAMTATAPTGGCGRNCSQSQPLQALAALEGVDQEYGSGLADRLLGRFGEVLRRGRDGATVDLDDRAARLPCLLCETPQQRGLADAARTVQIVHRRGIRPLAQGCLEEVLLGFPADEQSFARRGQSTGERASSFPTRGHLTVPFG